MDYLSDNKSIENTVAQSGDDIVTKTLSSLARRVDRRRSFAWSLAFLCVIFALCVVVGGLLYVYLFGIGKAFSFQTEEYNTFIEWLRATLKLYLYASLPVMLVFATGFTRISSLVGGVICAAAGIMCGYITVYAYSQISSVSDVGRCVAYAAFLGAYCFCVICFSSVCVSFSHLAINISDVTDKAFDEDLKCYFKYFMTCISWILPICTMFCLI